MKYRRLLVWSLAAASLCGVVLAADPTSQPNGSAETQQQLQDEVHQLQAEMQAMKQQQAAATQSAPVRSSDTTGLEISKGPATGPVTGATAGYIDNRFFVQSPDANFVLRPWFHLQLREVLSDRQDFKTDGSSEVDNGFELRRMRFGADGNLFGQDLTYFFNWATVRASGTATVTGGGKSVGTVSNNLGGDPLLEEAWLKYTTPRRHFSCMRGRLKIRFITNRSSARAINRLPSGR